MLPEIVYQNKNCSKLTCVFHQDFFPFQMKFVFILVPWGTWVCAHQCKGEHQNFGLCTVVQLCCVAQQLFPWWQSRAHKDSLYNHPTALEWILYVF